MVDAHNFYFCVLALLVVEDMQIGLLMFVFPACGLRAGRR